MDATGDREGGGRMSRRCGFVALLAALLIPQVAICAGLSKSKEYELKAAFVYNFTKFIEWPPQSFATVDAPIVIGVLGDCALGPQLDKLVKDRTVHGRSLVVTQVENVEQALLTHVLFVSRSESALYHDIRPSIQDRAILIVGESQSFLLRDGAIKFVMEAGVPRFEINMRPVDRAGLRMSSQLQKLAKIVFKD